MLRENRTVKNYLSAFADMKALQATNEAAFHFGANTDTKQKKLKPEERPTNLGRDVHCCFSLKMRNCPREQQSFSATNHNSSFYKPMPRKSTKLSGKESLQMNTKISAKSKQGSLIGLRGLIDDEPTVHGRRRTTLWTKDGKQHSDEFREKYCNDWDQTEQSRKEAKQRRDEVRAVLFRSRRACPSSDSNFRIIWEKRITKLRSISTAKFSLSRTMRSNSKPSENCRLPTSNTVSDNKPNRSFNQNAHFRFGRKKHRKNRTHRQL